MFKLFLKILADFFSVLSLKLDEKVGIRKEIKNSKRAIEAAEKYILMNHDFFTALYPYLDKLDKDAKRQVVEFIDELNKYELEFFKWN